MKTAKQNEQEMLSGREAERKAILKNMKNAFLSMDLDASGSLSKAEFFEAITTDDLVMNSFVQLGLDEEENLFETLDAEGNGELTFNQFFEGALLLMKGHETAKAKDIVRSSLVCQAIAGRVKAINADVQAVKRTCREQRKRFHTLESSISELLTEMCGLKELLRQRRQGKLGRLSAGQQQESAASSWSRRPISVTAALGA